MSKGTLPVGFPATAGANVGVLQAHLADGTTVNVVVGTVVAPGLPASHSTAFETTEVSTVFTGRDVIDGFSDFQVTSFGL